MQGPRPSTLLRLPIRRPSKLCAFVGDRRGAAAIEFAIVGFALITSMLFIAMVALFLYLNQALDYATQYAARQIMTGAVYQAGLSQSQFISQIVCPALPASMACSNVIANVQVVPEAQQPNGYYTFVNNNQTSILIPTPLSNANANFSVGGPGSYIYVQIIYPITYVPSFMSALLSRGTTFNGTNAYPLISTAAFKNEQFAQ